MKRIFGILILVLALAPCVRADYDPVLEAQEKARHDAQARAAAEQKAKNDAMIRDMQNKANAEVMASKRKALGVSAQGKSDAEVNQMYAAMMQKNQQDAFKGAQEARNAMSQGQGAAALKQVTGKTLHELENMSDAEAEALANEMEKKYGNGN